MKIATIFGTLLQFIKAVMVSRVLRAMQGVREILIHTCQPYDNNMSDMFFDDLEMPAPEYNWGKSSFATGMMPAKRWLQYSLHETETLYV